MVPCLTRKKGGLELVRKLAAQHPDQRVVQDLMKRELFYYF